MNLWAEFRKNLSTVLQIVLVCLLVGLLAVFVIVMYFEPRWIFDLLGLSSAEVPETVAGNSKYEVLKFIGISMGGVLIALQALIANKRANAMDKTAQAQADAAQAQAGAAEAQARATAEQANANRLTEQGQRQERLKNAIEHLGHKSDSVRMGGAYELFLLAQGTEDMGLRQTVFEILCAHLRRTTGESEYRTKHKSKPSEKVQSLLTLLFVQDHDVFRELHIKLQGAWLNGANLRGARLEKSILSEAYLRGAELAEANVKEADMTKAHVQGANLTKARMQRACLRKAWMQGARLNGARLNEAKLHWVKMQGAELKAAQMQGASFMYAEMQGADLYEARLQLAYLTDVNLQAAHIVRGQFQAATLSGVRLGGVTSGGSGLTEVRIRDRIGRQGSLVWAIFQGGLTERDVEYILKIVSCEEPSVLRARLESHVDAPESHELPEGSGATTDPYTKEEAERWIAEYEQAMSEVPKDDS